MFAYFSSAITLAHLASDTLNRLSLREQHMKSHKLVAHVVDVDRVPGRPRVLAHNLSKVIGKAVNPSCK